MRKVGVGQGKLKISSSRLGMCIPSRGTDKRGISESISSRS
jgi:hypothetical protein